MEWKIVVFTLFAVTSLTLTTGCATSGGGAQQETESKNKVRSNEDLSLEDYLRRLNNVQVTGRGDNLRISIRGNMSITNAYEPPLFILNGKNMGTNYARVANAVVKGSITSVEAVPASQASLYGMEGGAGVIVIETE